MPVDDNFKPSDLTIVKRPGKQRRGFLPSRKVEVYDVKQKGGLKLGTFLTRKEAQTFKNKAVRQTRANALKRNANIKRGGRKGKIETTKVKRKDVAVGVTKAGLGFLGVHIAETKPTKRKARKKLR